MAVPSARSEHPAEGRDPRGQGLSGTGGRDHGPFGEKNFNCPERAVRSVVVASCEDDDLWFGDDVDEAVFVVDSS